MVGARHWTRDQLDKLREGYALRSSAEIAAQLGKSPRACMDKAWRLGLRKAPERLEEMGRENVRRRWKGKADAGQD